MTEMNRRTLLKGSVAMGAAALFGSEAAHAAGAVALPKKWDETTEVLVIGSGFAGLAAAIEAKKAGAKVEARRQLHHQRRHSDGYRLPAAVEARH